MLTQQYLKEALIYNSDNGILIWNPNRPKTHFKKDSIWKCFISKYANKEAGTLLKSKQKSTKYKLISLNGKGYLAHRLIWLYLYNSFPKHEIDHIDGNGLNNRITNLRDVPLKENQKNKKLEVRNKSGICGVSWHSASNMWRATIKIEGKCIHLGTFKNIKEAELVRKQAEIKFGFHKNHGRIL